MSTHLRTDVDSHPLAQLCTRQSIVDRFAKQALHEQMEVISSGKIKIIRPDQRVEVLAERSRAPAVHEQELGVQEEDSHPVILVKVRDRN